MLSCFQLRFVARRLAMAFISKQFIFVILGLNVLGAFAVSSQDATRIKQKSCIQMTPEKERQIDIIVEKLGDFLNNLTVAHEHFDIRLVKLDIEQHSDDEEEEKETVLQLSVNDCAVSEEELDEIKQYKDEVRSGAEELNEKKQHKEKKEVNSGAVEGPDGGKPSVMSLDIEENGRRLLKELETRKGGKRPLLVYVQKDRGQLDYLFTKK